MQLSKHSLMAHHLLYNHYPPLPMSWVKPCLRAVVKANKGEWNKRVRFPSGGLADVATVIDACHLQDFISGYSEWEE
jgi:hypothetical protein